MSVLKKDFPIKTLVKMQADFSRLYADTELIAVNADGIHVTPAGIAQLIRRSGQTPVVFPFSRTAKEVKIKIDGVVFFALVQTKVAKENGWI